MSKAKDIYLEINNTLTVEGEREKKRVSEIILQHYYGLQSIDIAVNRDFDYNTHQNDVRRCIELVNKNVPIQHIIGETVFYGLDFHVNSSVLIPRPETEELVDLILGENKNEALTVLDIGTGSGCIPISLKVNRESWKVKSMDVSEDALQVAHDNAIRNGVDVAFVRDSIFLPEHLVNESYDIIVSNPPYITEDEKKLMSPNVLDHEPHLALFVSNRDPLVFYRAILHLAKDRLNNNGKVYFEINEYFGNQMISLCSELGFDQVCLHKDLSGKDRMISCIFSGN